MDESGTLDLSRLMRAAKAMKDDGDYDRYAYLALTKGYPGEAKMVLEEGAAAGLVDLNKSPFKEEMAQAKTKSAGEQAGLGRCGSARPWGSDREGCAKHRRSPLRVRRVCEGCRPLSCGAQEDRARMPA